MTFADFLALAECPDRTALRKYLNVTRQLVYTWEKNNRVPDVWVYRVKAMKGAE